MNDPAMISQPRSPHDYIQPAALRQLIKQTLGYNGRQITVSGGSSIRYLTVTIRDAAVDVAKVREFAKGIDTWTMDNTDYCEGQSIKVETTQEVDQIHGAPFVAEIKMAVGSLMAGECGKGKQLSNGKWLWVAEQGYWVTRDLNSVERGCYLWPADVQSFAPWAIAALALQMAMV